MKDSTLLAFALGWHSSSQKRQMESLERAVRESSGTHDVTDHFKTSHEVIHQTEAIRKIESRREDANRKHLEELACLRAQVEAKEVADGNRPAAPSYGKGGGYGKMAG